MYLKIRATLTRKYQEWLRYFNCDDVDEMAGLSTYELEE